MLLTLNGAVTQVFASSKSGRLYLTVADADTLTLLKVSSERVSESEVRPFLDQRGKIEMLVKASSFVSQESGERQSLEVMAFKFTPLSAAQPEPVKKPA